MTDEDACVACKAAAPAEVPLIRPPGAFSPSKDGEKGKWGWSAPEGRMRGLFSGKCDDRRGRLRRARSCTSRSPPHPPSGHLLPVEGRGEGKMGEVRSVVSPSLRLTKWGEGKMGEVGR